MVRGDAVVLCECCHKCPIEVSCHVCRASYSPKNRNVRMTSKTKVKQWAELKLAGNECFKAGQYGEATRIYSLAISELHKSSKSASILTAILNFILTYTTTNEVK